MRPISGIAATLVAVATALVLLVVAVTPFLTPAWVSFEQERADAAAWTGYSRDDLRTATEAILTDLVVGPPAFDVSIGGKPVLIEAERSHMRDVRRVFSGFYLAGVVAFAILLAGRFAAGRVKGWSPREFWGAIRIGGLGLLLGVVVAGIGSVVAFDVAFEAFHKIFFSAGTYLFDPQTDRLVQLFPERFWSETAIAVGVLAAGLSVVALAGAARRRARTDRDLEAGVQ